MVMREDASTPGQAARTANFHAWTNVEIARIAFAASRAYPDSNGGMAQTKRAGNACKPDVLTMWDGG
jgi:hypothetical protein